MNQDFLATVHKVTPFIDKCLALAGASVAAVLTLGHVQTIVGVAVGIFTILAMIPRIVIGYIDMRRKIRHADEEEETDEKES